MIGVSMDGYLKINAADPSHLGHAKGDRGIHMAVPHFGRTPLPRILLVPLALVTSTAFHGWPPLENWEVTVRKQNQQKTNKATEMCGDDYKLCKWQKNNFQESSKHKK